MCRLSRCVNTGVLTWPISCVRVQGDAASCVPLPTLVRHRRAPAHLLPHRVHEEVAGPCLRREFGDASREGDAPAQHRVQPENLEDDAVPSAWGPRPQSPPPGLSSGPPSPVPAPQSCPAHAGAQPVTAPQPPQLHCGPRGRSLWGTGLGSGQVRHSPCLCALDVLSSPGLKTPPNAPGGRGALGDRRRSPPTPQHWSDLTEEDGPAAAPGGVPRAGCRAPVQQDGRRSLRAAHSQAFATGRSRSSEAWTPRSFADPRGAVAAAPARRRVRQGV